MAAPFEKWLDKHGGKKHANLDLVKELPSGDRGVVATAPIAEGELLLLLPINCSLYMPNDEEWERRGSSFPEAVRYLHEHHRTLSPFLATTLALMSEVARGGESAWAAYVGTLPASCPDCLLNWSAQEKKDLEGTALEEQGPDPAADAFERHVAPIVAARRDLWPAQQGKGEGEAAGDLALFLRAAGLVQSRAFHLEAENWVSGAKEISKLEGGGTQVFLLPGIDMINHSHDAGRRNAHLQRLNVAQAAAAKLTEGDAPEGVDAYFVMRADKPIAEGEEVLHTYGNLSDAQLLQTYGFLDSEDDFAQLPDGAASGSGSQQPEAAAEDAGGKGGKKGGKKRGKAGAAAAKGKEEAAEAAAGAGGFRNPYNAALVPWEAVEDVCCTLMKSMDQGPPTALKRAKRDFLAAAGVLQAAAPEATQFVLLAREPLPDELLTAVQVLLMTKEEFNELKREHGASLPAGGSAAGGKKGAASKSPAKGAAGKGKKGKGGAAAAKAEEAAEEAGKAGEGAAAALPKLSLGTALLEEDEDFAEMVCIATLQVLKSCVERYPSTSKEDVRLLKSGECTGRQRLAVRVRLGEKDVLQLAQKAVVELLRKLREGEPIGQDTDEEEEEEEKPQGKKGAKGKAAGKAQKPAAKKRRGLGAEASSDDDMAAEAEATAADEEEDDDGLLAGSDDSERVGYGADDFDDGIGEAHDRGKPHEAPKASE
ncbi:hypothetical protein HXX76_008818 [Chlamydomonas incerta]|uniref:SET domain-containing protein n=1 Tax=Chlamydomonas incerta TaxID=51695 RepID=A0A835SSR9_CHLIN|nr:hypothetical protein HXX76_008818 [Chlamydomonas incerta]|eukprot:KAG2432473.1 hypothetical protein HXX76_008818 [Chlamydomonas incerta]